MVPKPNEAQLYFRQLCSGFFLDDVPPGWRNAVVKDVHVCFAANRPERFAVHTSSPSPTGSKRAPGRGRTPARAGTPVPGLRTADGTASTGSGENGHDEDEDDFFTVDDNMDFADEDPVDVILPDEEAESHSSDEEEADARGDTASATPSDSAVKPSFGGNFVYIRVDLLRERNAPDRSGAALEMLSACVSMVPADPRTLEHIGKRHLSIPGNEWWMDARVRRMDAVNDGNEELVSFRLEIPNGLGESLDLGTLLDPVVVPGPAYHKCRFKVDAESCGLRGYRGWICTVLDFWRHDGFITGRVLDAASRGCCRFVDGTSEAPSPGTRHGGSPSRVVKLIRDAMDMRFSPLLAQDGTLRFGEKDPIHFPDYDETETEFRGRA